MKATDPNKLDRIVAEARRAAANERTADADIARGRGFGIETAVTHGVHG